MPPRRFILVSILCLLCIIAPKAYSQSTITFAFTGDIMMGTTYPDSIHHTYLPSNQGALLFDDAKSILVNADITAGNLEGTMLDRGGVVKRCQDPALCYAFRTPTAYVKNLKNAGFDMLSLANNHINDFGAAGLCSTQKTLKDVGIAYAGVKGQCETAVIERNGIRYGYCAFGHSKVTCSINNYENAVRILKQIRKDCDILVVSFHGGGEGTSFSHVPHKKEECFGEPRGNVEEFAHLCIDNGADIVYGHGPHVVRAMELYKGHFIAYSLGNFCTPYRVRLTGKSGYAPVVEVTTDLKGNFIRGKIHSFVQQRGKGPKKDATSSAAKEIRALTLSDFPKTALQISPTGDLTKK